MRDIVSSRGARIKSESKDKLSSIRKQKSWHTLAILRVFFLYTVSEILG